jgi:hypothetical protein
VSWTARLRQSLDQLGRSEQGIALPMAMLMTAIALGFAAVPILSSISSQSGTSRDQGTNVALTAAEAGVSLAMLRQNQVKPTSEKPCVGESGGKLVVAAAQTAEPEKGWCTPVTLTSTSVPAPPPGTEVTYRVKPCYPQSACTGVTTCGSTTDNMKENLVKVVSTGTATVSTRKLTRRVSISACSKAVTKTTETLPPDVFAGGQTVGVDWIRMSNNAQVYSGGIGTNGVMKEMVGSANVCGKVQYGESYVPPSNGSENPPPNCPAGRTFVKGTTEYPSVVLPTEIATKNSNARLDLADPVGPDVYQRGNINWNSSKKELTVGYDQLTLEGTDAYYLCRLVLAGGSKLLSGAGKKIRIFFAPPSACSGLNGAAQLQIANGAYVGADSYSGPGFYFVGSETPGASQIELGGGATVSQFVVYAPNSTIVAANGVNLNGAIIGETLTLAGGAQINKNGFTPPSLEDFLPSTKVTTTEPEAFARKAYVQCSSAALTTSPESGC